LEIDPNTAEFATAATRWFRKAIELNEKLGSRLRQRRFRTSDGGLTFSEEVLFPALVQALSAGVRWQGIAKPLRHMLHDRLYQLGLIETRYLSPLGRYLLDTMARDLLNAKHTERPALAYALQYAIERSALGALLGDVLAQAVGQWEGTLEGRRRTMFSSPEFARVLGMVTGYLFENPDEPDLTLARPRLEALLGPNRPHGPEEESALGTVSQVILIVRANVVECWEGAKESTEGLVHTLGGALDDVMGGKEPRDRETLSNYLRADLLINSWVHGRPLYLKEVRKLAIKLVAQRLTHEFQR
jgi:hypothetical protein